MSKRKHECSTEEPTKICAIVGDTKINSRYYKDVLKVNIGWRGYSINDGGFSDYLITEIGQVLQEYFQDRADVNISAEFKLPKKPKTSPKPKIRSELEDQIEVVQELLKVPYKEAYAILIKQGHKTWFSPHVFRTKYCHLINVLEKYPPLLQQFQQFSTYYKIQVVIRPAKRVYQLHYLLEQVEVNQNCSFCKRLFSKGSKGFEAEYPEFEQWFQSQQIQEVYQSIESLHNCRNKSKLKKQKIELKQNQVQSQNLELDDVQFNQNTLSQQEKNLTKNEHVVQRSGQQKSNINKVIISTNYKLENQNLSNLTTPQLEQDLAKINKTCKLIQHQKNNTSDQKNNLQQTQNSQGVNNNNYNCESENNIQQKQNLLTSKDGQLSLDKNQNQGKNRQMIVCQSNSFDNCSQSVSLETTTNDSLCSAEFVGSSSQFPRHTMQLKNQVAKTQSKLFDLFFGEQFSSQFLPCNQEEASWSQQECIF